MHWIATRLFLFTACVGLNAALWVNCHSSQLEPTKREQISSKPDSVAQDLEFNLMSGGKGEAETGVPSSHQFYEASDGVEISVTRENRDTPLRASEALQKRIQKAVKIIERGSKLDERGQQVGDRVVAILAHADPDKEQAVVLWTNGSQLYYIQSLSLRHALELEKRYYQ